MLMMMPMGPCTGSEHDIVDCDALLFVAEDGIGPDVTGEGRSAELGLFARRAGIADNCHRHVELSMCKQLSTREVWDEDEEGCSSGYSQLC